MFDIGDPVPLSVQIKDAAGTLANATTVQLTITEPDGTIAGPFTITPTSTGVYDYDFTPTQVGRHLARWVATGANASAYTDAFEVQSGDPRGIISLADAKNHLNKDDSTDDEELRLYLSAITSLIEKEVGTTVPKTATETLGALNVIVLRESPVSAITSLVTANTNTDLSSYFVLDSKAGVLNLSPTSIGYPFAYRPYVFPGQPLDRLYYQGILPFYPGQPVTVTYTAGMNPIPPAYQLAARIILADLWKARRGAAPRPVRGADDEELPVIGDGYKLPDEALLLLGTSPRAPRVG